MGIIGWFYTICGAGFVLGVVIASVAYVPVMFYDDPYRQSEEANWLVKIPLFFVSMALVGTFVLFVTGAFWAEW